MGTKVGMTRSQRRLLRSGAQGYIVAWGVAQETVSTTCWLAFWLHPTSSCGGIESQGNRNVGVFLGCAVGVAKQWCCSSAGVDSTCELKQLCSWMFGHACLRPSSCGLLCTARGSLWDSYAPSVAELLSVGHTFNLLDSVTDPLNLKLYAMQCIDACGIFPARCC